MRTEGTGGGWGHYALGQIAYEWGDLDGAREAFRGRAGARPGHPSHLLGQCDLGLALTLIARGEPAAAERLVLAELEEAEEAGYTFFVEGLRSFKARLALASDDPDGAVDWVARVHAHTPGHHGTTSRSPLLTRARVLVAQATPGTSARLGRCGPRDRGRRSAARGPLARGGAGAARPGRALARRDEPCRRVDRAGPGGRRTGQFTRTFVDLRPPGRVLAELASHGGLPGGARCSSRVGRSPLCGRRPAGPGRGRAEPRRGADLARARRAAPDGGPPRHRGRSPVCWAWTKRSRSGKPTNITVSSR